MTNLIETLDATLALYAPLLTRWMEENPGFHGIGTVIRREEPAAYPRADVPPGYADGYSDEAFEVLASQELLRLVAPTYEILSACPMVADEERALSVSARRVVVGKPKSKTPNMATEIRVSLSGSLSGIFVLRSAVCLNPAGVFALQRPTMTLTTMPTSSEAQIEILKSTAEKGLSELAVQMDEGELLLNNHLGNSFRVLDWVNAFPDAGTVQLDEFPSPSGHILRFWAGATKPILDLYATDDYCLAKPMVVETYRSVGMSVGRLEDLLPEMVRSQNSVRGAVR